MTFDCIVIGAGIVGAACATAFSRDGMRVALVDPAEPGLGATAAGMGHVVVMDDSPAQLLLTHYSQTLWHALASSLPTAAEYQTAGTLWVAADSEEMTEVERKHACYASSGVATEIIGPDRLRALEPSLRLGLVGALLVPGDVVLYAPAAAAWLCRHAEEQGSERFVARAVSIGRGRVVLDDGRELAAPRIVNATGEFAPSLTPGIGIRRRKGHLAITDRYPGLLRHQIVELGYLRSAHSLQTDSVAFNVQPRITGQVLIGSSRQYDVATPEVDSAILSRMLQRAVDFLPALADRSVLRVWTGFRAATEDKLPLIGPLPSDDTVFLATGHEGLGITTSLATAELLASHFAGREPAIPIDPYLPERAAVGVAHAG